MRSSAMPQPRTTQVSGVLGHQDRYGLLGQQAIQVAQHTAPPPVSIMPRSAMSAPSSGGVCSSAFLTADTIWLSGSVRRFEDCRS